MPFEDRPKEEEYPRDFFRGRGYVEGRDRIVNGETDLLQIVETGKTGQGLVAKVPIKQGEKIFGIHGREEMTEQDYEKKFIKIGQPEIDGLWNLTRNPNFYLPNAICIGQKVTPDYQVMNTWLDPYDDNPLRFLDHSCDPNTKRWGTFNIFSLRDIKMKELITIDYSTLEVNPDWRMICHCGSPHCRREIRSIQFLTPEQIEPSWTELPHFLKKIYLESADGMYQGKNDREILERLKENQASIGFSD